MVVIAGRCRRLATICSAKGVGSPRRIVLAAACRAHRNRSAHAKPPRIPAPGPLHDRGAPQRLIECASLMAAGGSSRDPVPFTRGHGRPGFNRAKAPRILALELARRA